MMFITFSPCPVHDNHSFVASMAYCDCYTLVGSQNNAAKQSAVDKPPLPPNCFPIQHAHKCTQ